MPVLFYHFYIRTPNVKWLLILGYCQAYFIFIRIRTFGAIVTPLSIIPCPASTMMVNGSLFLGFFFTAVLNKREKCKAEQANKKKRRFVSSWFFLFYRLAVGP